jgi:nitroreductase
MTAATVDRATLLEVVDDARRAPSLYNAQPWAWRLLDPDAGVLELHADRSRRIPLADPDDRHLTVGCGAALHHARVAAEGRGLAVGVRLLPAPDRPDLLATLEVAPDGPDDVDARLLPALRSRRTDRRRFSTWPVPPERVEHLAAVATAEGTAGLAITDDVLRHRVETLVARAWHQVVDDEPLQAEMRSWLDRADDGVPRVTVPRLVPREDSYRSRFGPGQLAQPDRDPGLVEADGLVLLAGPDTPAGWLRSGLGLSAAWLLAEATGLSVVPLTQVVESADTREALARELPGDDVPHVLLRVGWLSPSRERLAPTTRRPLSEVVVP